MSDGNPLADAGFNRYLDAQAIRRRILAFKDPPIRPSMLTMVEMELWIRLTGAEHLVIRGSSNYLSEAELTVMRDLELKLFGPPKGRFKRK